MSDNLDPDLEFHKGGDPGYVMQQRKSGGFGMPKRLSAAFAEHQKLILALQKLSYAKGVGDKGSPLNMLPFDAFVYDQIQIVNFVYNNIITRFYQQQKQSRMSIPPSIKDKRRLDNGGDESTKKRKAGKRRTGKRRTKRAGKK
jgi:hypothetical protein